MFSDAIGGRHGQVPGLLEPLRVLHRHRRETIANASYVAKSP